MEYVVYPLVMKNGFAMENEPLVRSFTVVENGDFPQLCEITIL